MSNIKDVLTTEIIEHKGLKVIEEYSGIVGIVGKELPDMIKSFYIPIFKGIVRSDGFMDILEGCKLLIKGLKTVDIKSIVAEIKESNINSSINEEVQQYFKDGNFDTVIDLVENYQKKSKDND